MIVPWKVLQQAGHTHSLEALWSQSFESTSTSRAAHPLRLEAIIISWAVGCALKDQIWNLERMFFNVKCFGSVPGSCECLVLEVEPSKRMSNQNKGLLRSLCKYASTKTAIRLQCPPGGHCAHSVLSTIPAFFFHAKPC